MRLDEYQWSHNPRGLHINRTFRAPLDHSRWIDPHFGWVKLLAGGTEYVPDARQFIDEGITPILRVYVSREGPVPFEQRLREFMDEYIQVGVKWFEFNNEPNLGVAWPSGTDANYADTYNIIRPVMENWLGFAEYIVSQGCYPGFIAFAETTNAGASAIPWLEACLTYMADNRFDRFYKVLTNGMFVAVHPYVLNHFYQEIPGAGPTSQRPPEQQNAEEGGWHFEYPYDPYGQRLDPGRTVFAPPLGDPVGLIAMGTAFNQKAAEMFGVRALPVVGTEGGIWPFDSEKQPDPHYPPYTTQSQAEATVAMFEWITKQAPPWHFGLTLWKEDAYYDEIGVTPAIHRLTDILPIYKDVPQMDVVTGNVLPGFQGTVTAPGPIPIHGEADFHMVILGPGLDSGWFFDTAQSYWNLFRPIVTTDVRLIDFITAESLAATIIAPPDVADTLLQSVTRQYPNVYVDLIVADDFTKVTNTFNQRVQVNRRFG